MALLTLPPDQHPTLPALYQTIYPAYLNTLLAVPNLMALLPLPSLMVLLRGIHFWDKLVPLAISRPKVLSTGDLATEMGKTHLLANISFMVVRSGMLQGRDARSCSHWTTLIKRVMDGLEEGWGIWVENQGKVSNISTAQLRGQEGLDRISDSAEDSEDDTRQPKVISRDRIKGKARRVDRGTIEPNIRDRLMYLFSPQHLNVLASKVVASDDYINPFTGLVTTMLRAFKGSPTWEAILDGILEGPDATKLQRQLWLLTRRDWANVNKPTWEQLFSDRPGDKCRQLPTLQLLSTLYLQNLLTLPDDEFFAPIRQTGSRSALTLDEVSELAGIWRDLAFWGYSSGTGSGPETVTTKRKEEVRSLTTQGVVAISARNARRTFLSPDFWIMIQMSEMATFIDLVCQEEQQLQGANEEEMGMDVDDESLGQSSVIPPWLRSRRLLSKRQMAKISPRLGLLNNLPMTLPFASRVEILSHFV